MPARWPCIMPGRGQPREPRGRAAMTTRPRSGRHFLQIPGPTNVPDRILRAIDRPTIDHRGPEFARLAGEILAAIRPIFKTAGPVVIYPASGTGAWEAALVNTLVAGRPGADGRDRPFRQPVARDGAAPRPRGRAAAGRLAPWRRSGADRGDARRRPRTSDQGDLRRPQRDLDRGHLAGRGGPPRDRRRRASRRSSWSTPSPRSPRSTTATTSGGSTSPSRARRRA